MARRRVAPTRSSVGCPEVSKIGTVEVKTPLLDRVLRGSLFLVTPYENPFGSLIALYMTVKSFRLGIVVKLAGRVQADPQTGQLIGAASDLPQLPFSSVRVRLREGARAPLITPPACGTYRTEAVLTPSSGTAPVTASSSFEINSGPGGGPCPNPNNPPFSPGFSAGAISNSANSYSPFVLRLTRQDGHQDLVRFSSALPRGVLGKIAGVSQCPEAQLALLKAKTGIEERDNPSCPANSLLGKTWAGAGVGSQLTYVPGRLYLAGPYNGAPLSVVAVTPAVAGPFDVGVVVVREALTLDPKTAQVSVDGAASDPIPHILAGIPLSVRDVRVMVDRPQFTRNPTNCSRSDVFARIGGGGLDPFSTADDTFVDLFAPYQAADCASLGFKPRLGFQLRGGTKRGGHPALQAVVRPREGDANISRAVVKLPRSAFLDQGHIRTICTRVQFAQKNCPKGAIYGRAVAFSPLVDGPLTGPVYLRSSNNTLPDLVVDLTGPPSAQIKVELVGRIDSVRGGIRSTFSGVPDAPVSKFILRMQGGKKGLIVNSRNLCRSTNRARVTMKGQNGKIHSFRPKVRAKCKRKRKAKRSSHSR